MKNIIFILLVTLLFTNNLFSQNKKSKQKVVDKTELEQRKKMLQQEIAQYNKQLEETKKDKRASMNNLLVLNQKIMKRQALINNINDELEFTNKEISENVNTINQLNSKLRTLRDNYANMILNAYKNRYQNTTINFLANAKDFNAGVRKIEYLKRIKNVRKNQIAAITETTLQLNTNVQQLEIKKDDQSKLLETKEQEKQIFNDEKSEKEKLVAQLQTREKELKNQIKKKQDDANKLTNAIKKIIEDEIRKARESAITQAKKKKKEAEKISKEKIEKQKKENTNKEGVASKEDQKKIDLANKEIEEAESAKSTAEVFALNNETQKLSSNFENNKNRLPWPIANGVITSSFGEHEHPVLKGIKIKNNGIDIKTKVGADSRAIFDGEVTGVINIPGAGKAIIVRHGEYLSVYSNLATANVSKGEKIKAKQAIGTVSAGETGNGELHFEIWKGQTTQNPQTWLAGKAQ